MKAKDIRRWLTKNLKNIQSNHGLEEWEIKTVVRQKKAKESGEGVTEAQMNCLSEYKRATITYFSPVIENEEALEVITEHELLHIIVRPFNDLYTIFNELIHDNNVRDCLDVLFMNCEEAVVTSLENRKNRRKK